MKSFLSIRSDSIRLITARSTIEQLLEVIRKAIFSGLHLVKLSNMSVKVNTDDRSETFGLKERIALILHTFDGIGSSMRAIRPADTPACNLQFLRDHLY